TRAFGAYSMRKDGLLRLLNIPNESFEKVHSVHVWRGEIYLRVIGSSPDAGAITRLAGVVAGKIPPAAGKPEVLALFPEKGRVVNTERYSMTSAFGQRFLGNAFLASFNIDGDRIEGLIIPSASKSAATRILDQYRQLYVRNGKLLDPITNLGDEDFAAEDRYLGRVVALRIDRYVVAFNGFRDRQHLVALAAETAQRIAKAP
ncbi:MAG TPA: DUF6599 family protein, partial [Thermoanaerobaculia bacterium]|nr:DUF6599 family protein [Thermoanaerobaculia bacterium]